MSQGAQTAIYIEPGSSPHTFDSSSERYEFRYENYVKTPRIVSSEGIRGTRQASKEQTREGQYTVGGPIVMSVTPGIINAWGPRFMGGTKSVNDIPFAETLPSFGVLKNLGEETFEGKDNYVNRALIHGRRGPDERLELLELTLDIWGLTMVTGTSVPSVSIGTTSLLDDPYHLAECVFTINAAAREVHEFWLLIDNHLQRRFVNSLAATAITSRAQTVMLDMVCPYTSVTKTMYAMSVAGVAASLAITNSTHSTTFTFGTLQAPVRSPNVVGKTELGLRVRGIARKSGSTNALTLANITP